MTIRTRTHRIVRVGGAGLMLALVPTLAACSAFSRSDVDYARPYPFDAERQDMLDVQVFREGTKLKMTNTTAHAFGPSTLWVNQRFSRPIDAFAPGETITLNLYDFRDQYQDAFRAGGFFATQEPDQVVLVELQPGDEAGGKLYGFVVVKNEMN
ncbi:MAG: hypothetical protein R3B57_13165 [Phycisphaerales bacterium]